MSEFQSTRPRGARRPQPDQRCTVCMVSIHAPARGATLRRRTRTLTAEYRFQSTRPRGARRMTRCVVRLRRSSFNPRARAGRDAAHARRQRDRVARRFNPRARAGRDDRSTRMFDGLELFQSTRPRGARRVTLERGSASGDRFNPRARAGRDAVDEAVRDCEGSFQSTRPRGARLRGFGTPVKS